MTTTLRPLPEGFRLDKGGHKPPNGEFAACLMEAVAYVAGEPWTDHPECASPVIAAFCREWQDAMNDEDRQMLAPYVTRLVGTRGTDEQEEERSWMATDWLVRECAPAWLRLAGLEEHAHTLERLAPLVDDASAERSQSDLSAADSAARSAARSAAYSAAYSAADSAARSAARSAAYSAARSAAYSALEPTVKALQVSALGLLDRMIAVTSEVTA